MTISLATSFSATYDIDGGTTASAATSAEVPAVYDVSIGGHPYMLDLKSGQFRHETIPVLRPVFIEADSLGEKQVNPESLWRASQNTWHKGAGQRHLDRPESDGARFWTSKGIDIWTRWQITLLPDTTQTRASANTNLRMTVAGTRLYVTDGNTLAYTTNLSAFTTITGTPAATATAITSDGYTVYAAYTANGLWTASPAGGAAAQLVTGTDTLSAVGYVRGRLMAAKGRSLYNVVLTTAGALGSATAPLVFDHPNPQFTWAGFAEGTGFIYAAGYAGDKTLIYRIAVQPDGTALTIPVQAGQLPDGEIVRGIGSYLGYILIGTDRGVRLAQPASNGDLEVGALITTSACRCFEGQDRFVWFGWDNYDTTSTGLGRMDLNLFNDTAPAYTSDLMVTGQGQVVDVATFAGQRVTAVAGLGFYGESTSLVPSGTLDSGLITYDLPEDKVALYLDVRHADPLLGQHVAYLSVDQGGFAKVGTHTSVSVEGPFTLPQYRGATFEIRQELDRAADPTIGPTITRQTLLSNPAVDSGVLITVPLLLAETLTCHGGVERTCDVAGELAYLKQLRADGKSLIYQEGGSSYAVTTQDLTWIPSHATKSRAAFNGTCLVKVKTI